MSEKIKLMQAMGSKFCHDFANSIGSLDNAVSHLNSDKPELVKSAKSLLTDEFGNLIKYVKTFRTIYNPDESGEALNLKNLKSLLTEYFTNPKIEVRFHINDSFTPEYHDFAKIVACLAVIASETIIYQGRLDIYVLDEEKQPISVEVNGKNLAIRKESIDGLLGGGQYPANAMNCREHYIRLMCEEAGYNIELKNSKTLIKYIISK